MLLSNMWYVGAWSNEIKDQALFERTIAGVSLVMFRQKDNEIAVINNMCPHRFAPLSMGKLVGDTVECRYHGLRFDASGQCVHNPHGQGNIPAKACVDSYPAVERHDMIWIWMGDPTLADPDQIPDFSCHTSAQFPTVCGVIEMEANYELITDNLMDLSHVEYVHEGILGSDAIKCGEHEVIQSGTTVYSNRWCPDGLAPPAWDAMFGHYGKSVDHWLYIRWDAPAHMLLDVGITPTGTPRNNGIWMYGTNILTPKDDNSTHYFWAVSRSYRIDDPAAGAEWEGAIKAAFVGQDKPMIEGQARMMNGRTVNELEPVLLTTDSASVRCRRIVTQLQESSEAAKPAHNLLSTLLHEHDDKAEQMKKIVPVV